MWLVVLSFILGGAFVAQSADVQGSLGGDDSNPSFSPPTEPEASPPPSENPENSMPAGDPSAAGMPSSGAIPGQLPGGGASSGGANKFQGGYIGLSASAVHIASSLDGLSYNGTGGQGGLLGGYGGQSKSGMYVGGEFGVYYGTFQKKQPGGFKMKSTYTLDFAALAGFVLKGTLMPYARLGGGVQGFTYEANGVKKNFSVLFFAPGLGFQGMVGDHFLLRLEANYGIPVNTTGIKKSRFKTVPARTEIKLAGLYKF